MALGAEDSVDLDLRRGARSAPAAEAPGGGHFIHIRARARELLVRIRDVSEVVPVMTLTDIGNLSSDCRGMLNLRGEMIPIFAVEGPADAGLELHQLILVARCGDEPLGLVVDDVVDVVVIPDEQVALRRIGGGKVGTFGRLGDAVLPVLDPSSVL
ncbi:MAG: chemotaxis protein CheW [Deltaproteobacteria bacterium]|jgi:purine-binding chemotaxis protein CheW|nr:chemotaxis protein CheW [Deltaproteobacteria bacterium]